MEVQRTEVTCLGHTDERGRLNRTTWPSSWLIEPVNIYVLVRTKFSRIKNKPPNNCGLNNIKVDFTCCNVVTEEEIQGWWYYKIKRVLGTFQFTPLSFTWFVASNLMVQRGCLSSSHCRMWSSRMEIEKSVLLLWLPGRWVSAVTSVNLWDPTFEPNAATLLQGTGAYFIVSGLVLRRC